MNRTARRRSAHPRPERRSAERRGRVAELMCRWHLRLRGWRIVARDWRCPSGEIDILARRGRVLAVIEVKSRPDFAAGAAALSPRQRRRIARATEVFLLTHPDLAAMAVRFDVMVVEPRRLPRHLPGAWRSDD